VGPGEAESYAATAPLAKGKLAKGKVMRIYLVLAAFWLAAGALVFAYPAYYPTAQRYTILDSNFSVGWLLLVFAAWNAVRWWTTRPMRRAPGREDEGVKG
jgi:hypothetical protein